MSPCKSQDVVFVATSILAAITRIISDQCEVLVHEPWPMPQLLVPCTVPNGSNVVINCTAAVGTADPPFWTINLPNDSSTTPIQFSNRKGRLNAHGVYELPPIETPLTLRLLINDTAINNQTEINCDTGTETITTILYVFDPTPLTLKVFDAGIGSVNLTWDLSLGGADQIFLLTISHGSSSDNVSLTESYYHFTAPEGAPSCEVYNFSVTATYVAIGATYTGAGCSVPSNIIEMMLPSLPNITRLESSLVYSLVQISKQFILNISFEPVDSCDRFSTLNYTLELRGPLPGMTVQSLPVVPTLGEHFIVENISNDSAFSFTILVSNTVGIISTKSRAFYTTDVQVITATLMEGVNASIIQCEFVAGSTASGCMVVLTGFEAHNITLTRNISTNLATTSVTLEHPPSCYTGVEAFDIESDGSVGSLAVPGQIGGRLETPHCLPAKPKAADSVPITIIVVVVVVIIVAVIMIIILLMAGITTMWVLRKKREPEPDSSADNQPREVATTAKGECLYSQVVPRDKRKKRASTNSADMKADNAYCNSEPTEAEPEPTEGYTSLLIAEGQEDTGAPSQEALYDQPIPVKAKTLEGRADNNRNDSRTSTANCEGTRATQDTHLYFILESDRATDKVISTPTSLLAPPNISDPPQPASNECPPPVYQEITDLKIRGQAPTGTVSGAGSISNTPLPSSSPPLIQRFLSGPGDTPNPVG